MKFSLAIYHLIIRVAIIHAANQYMGCFIDQIGDRDLGTFIGEYEQLSPKQCILACQEQNFHYAAIQFGDECRCGHQYGKHGQVSEQECGYYCSTSEKCGGDFRNSVYNVVRSLLNEVTTDSPLLLEKLVREKRAVAGTDSTQVSDITSSSTTLGDSTSSNAVSDTAITSQPLMSTNSISFIYSSTNEISTPIYSSVMMSNAASSTFLSSTIMTEITITSSHLSSITPNSPTETDSSSTMNPSSTSSTSAFLASTNVLTNTMNNVESSTTYSATLSPSGTSSLFYTDTNVPMTIITQSTITSYTTQFNSNSGIQSTDTFSTILPAISTMINAPMSSEITSTGSGSLNTLSSSIFLSNNPTSITDQTSVTTTTSSTTTSTTTTSTTTSTTTTSTTTSTSTTATTTTTTTTLTTTTTTTSTTTRTTTTTTTSTTTTTATTTTTTVTTATTATTTTATTTTTTTTTTVTTVPESTVISTIIIVPAGIPFDPNNTTNRADIRRRLTNIINLAFRCLIDLSYPNCTQSTQSRQRAKRQFCTSDFIVNLISNILQISDINGLRRFLIQFIVMNPCNQNSLLSAVQVRTATDTLSPSQISTLLGYQYEGDFARSSTNVTTETPVEDRKLWIIGAVLGPVAFSLLLICAFCYLHFKCRPRPINRNGTTVKPNVPTSTSQAPPYQQISEEPIIQEKQPVVKDLRALVQNDPVTDPELSARQTTPILSARQPTPILSARNPIHHSDYSIADDVPMNEIRRQNDVERWRNKLRLQDKFQQSSAPNSDRSETSQYNNRALEYDPSHINLQPASEIIADNSPRSMPRKTNVEVGRTKLHRLLDEVLDKADSDDVYNPDSDTEQQRRRRQRRRNNSISNGQPSQIMNPPIPHKPVVAQVSERPDPSLVRLRYNPYEAGDRAHYISRFAPVELQPKLTNDDDDERLNQYSSRSNPPLFFDDSTIADRAATATNAYANPKRFGKTRIETDQQAAMRYDGGRIDQRQHKFTDNAVYLDTISKNHDGYRVQARTAWVESDINHDSPVSNDYITAKRTAANTRNIISSIHNELQHISKPSLDDYRA